jgi:hypothetical protein
MQRPMLREAPVTSATLPASSFVVVMLRFSCSKKVRREG